MVCQLIFYLLFYLHSWKKTRTRTSLMDRQARKLQIAREQQGLYEGSTTSINPNETTDSHSTATANAAGATSLGGGSASSVNRVSDLSVLSDDDDKEVII